MQDSEIGCPGGSGCSKAAAAARKANGGKAPAKKKDPNELDLEAMGLDAKTLGLDAKSLGLDSGAKPKAD